MTPEQSLQSHTLTVAAQVVASHRSKPVVVAAPAQRVRQVSANTRYDVPLVALQAYRNAADVLRKSAPACHLSWPMLAAIGQVESNHGRFGGAVVLADGTTSPSIVGPALDGRGGVQQVRDTDNGRLDGDKTWDRAVGPMQFLPATWAVVGVDADADGVRNPNDINDAALAAGTYLCAGSGDLRAPAQARAAVYRYNHSKSYVNLVLTLAAAYAHGAATTVDTNLFANDVLAGLSPSLFPAAPRRAGGPHGGRSAKQKTHGGANANLKASRVPHSAESPRRHSSGTGSQPLPALPSTTTRAPTSSPVPTTSTPTTATPTPRPTPTVSPTSTPTPTTTSTPTPTPTPTTTSTPTTTPTPTTTSTPTTTPTPSPPSSEPSPSFVTLVGRFTACDKQWCLQNSPLDFGVNPDLTVVQENYDGDMAAEPVRDELTGLAGTRVHVVTDASGLVVQINRLAYVDDEVP
jgi:hypothetical protein